MLLSVTGRLDRRAGRDFISNARVVLRLLPPRRATGGRLLVAEVEATLSGQADIRATVENGWFVTRSGHNASDWAGRREKGALTPAPLEEMGLD